MTRLYLVRHGQTALNFEGRLQGSSDAELNSTGLGQAHDAAESLAAVLDSSVFIVSSPLLRAHRTAEVIASAVGASVDVDRRLVERGYGVWEGVPDVMLSEEQPEQYKVWRDGGEPNVEGYEVTAAVVARMREAFDDWRRRVPGDLLFVSHGTSSRLLMLDLLSLPTDTHALGSLETAAWSRISTGDDTPWTLERHNIGAGP